MKTLDRSLTILLGIAVAVIVANLYYSQPIASLISASLSLNPASTGLIVMLTQIGYGLGVVLLIPLADIVENKKLILYMLGLCAVSLIGLGYTQAVIPYFIAALFVGMGASTVQVIVPYTASLVPEAKRGRTVGLLMSGLMIGIMLSRPFAGIVTDLFSWHAVFFISAGFIGILIIVLNKRLPERRPQNHNLRYADLLGSMVQLFLRTPVLRRRGIYQGFMFGAFSLFWTAIPLYLSGPEFGFSQTAIALFALAGVAGAVSAPLAGRWADRGLSRQGTAIAMVVGITSFLATMVFAPGTWYSLAALVFGAIFLDAAITANLVLGQRAIFSLRAKYRGRLNGLYVATLFVGGSFGSFIGAWAFAKGGWVLTAFIGALFPTGALLFFLTEWLTGFNKKGYRKIKTPLS